MNICARRELRRNVERCVSVPERAVSYIDRVAQRLKPLLAVRGPQTTLDPEIIALSKNRRERDPPLLRYGLVVSRALLENYATQHSLVNERQPVLEDADNRYRLREAAVDHLAHTCRFALQIAYPLAAHDKLCLLTLDDTRRLCTSNKALWEKRSRPVIRFLRRELALKPTTKAKWWWDSRYDEMYVLRSRN